MNSEDQMTVGLHNGGSASGQPSTKSKMANPFAVNFSLIFIGASETPTVELIDFLRSPPLATLDAWKESLARLLPAGSLPNASMGYRVQVIPGLNTGASYASILFKLKELITSNTLIIIEPQAYEAAKQLAREIRVHKIINPLVALSPLRLNQTGWRNAAISLLYNGADRFISMHEDKRVIEAHIRALMLSINDQPTIKFIDAPPFRLSIANDSSVNLFIRAPQGDEQSISLRPRESAILALLAAKQNTAVSTREILGSSNRDLSETESLPNGDKSVDVHICNIRRRMDGAAVGLYGENRVQPSCNLIETVRGRGYRLNQNYDGLRPQAALHTLNAKIDTPQQGG